MLLEELQVGLGDRSYRIEIGQGCLAEVGSALEAIRFPRRVALVTNPVVGQLYADVVQSALVRQGMTPFLITIPDGEEAKTLATVAQVYDALMAHGLDRGCGLIALGGGVVGDLAGFVAATFLRGIPFAQIPTTLLSQVDSSVGGKTGVNHPSGKNLIGAFWQPSKVLIDVEVLKTLSDRDYTSGLAEVVKYGVIRDRSFFDWLEANAVPLLEREPQALVAAIKRSCQIKADIVERDERESGLRAILNYGHTFGHAVENLAGYGEYRHGEAVAIGMVVAAEISCSLGLCQGDDVQRLRELLIAFHLPTVPPAYPLDAVLEAIARDKKVHSGVLRMVLNRGIGDSEIRTVEHPRAVFAEILTR